MEVSQVVEIIVALLGFIGTIATVIVSNNKKSAEIDAKLEKNQAVQDERIQELTREVRDHNNFARRMPVVEEQISQLTKRLDDTVKEMATLKVSLIKN